MEKIRIKSRKILIFSVNTLEWIIILLLCWVVNTYIGGKLSLLGVVESHGPWSSILDLSINGILAIQQPKTMTTAHPESSKHNMWVITKLTSILFASKSFFYETAIPVLVSQLMVVSLSGPKTMRRLLPLILLSLFLGVYCKDDMVTDFAYLIKLHIIVIAKIVIAIKYIKVQIHVSISGKISYPQGGQRSKRFQIKRKIFQNNGTKGRR